MKPEQPTPTSIDLSMIAPTTEISGPFLQGMLDRMTVSYYKYGPIAVGFPTRVDALGSLQRRLDKYRETRNTEFLIDAANFAMIEFIHPSLDGAHFSPTDSSGSPGRITQSGEVTMTERNDQIAEARRPN